MIQKYFEFLSPLLMITWATFRVGRVIGLHRLSGPVVKPAIMAAAAIIAFYPVNGLSVSGYLLSINPNYSIGAAVFFLILLWNDLGREPLLPRGHFLWFSLWNVVVSLCLFASTLGFIGLDIYKFGYGFSAWFVATALLTGILVFFKNPLAYIFIAYIGAFDLKLLYSDNFFDYITDGALFLMSLLALTFHGARYAVSRYRNPNKATHGVQ